MSLRADNLQFSAEAKIGFEAALQEIEHQAEHWDTPEHRATGHLIAEALRSSVSIARDGGLQCDHRGWRCTFVGAPADRRMLSSARSRKLENSPNGRPTPLALMAIGLRPTVI